MAYDPHQRRRIAERCWLIYDLIIRNFSPPQEFHLKFPELAELALISGALRVRVQIGSQGHSQMCNLAGHGLSDTSGNALANGVYLYVVAVKGWDGTVVRSEVWKLVILR